MVKGSRQAVPSIEDSDSELDELVEKSVARLAALKPNSGAKTLNALHCELLDSGKLKPSLVTTDNGTIVKRNGGKPGNLQSQQENSQLYGGCTTSIAETEMGKKQKATLGRGWFDLEPMEMDDKLQREVKLIELRNYLDPKRFYKNPDKMKNILHTGTVIEGRTEYKSCRLNRKERRQSIAEEILADKYLTKYSKNTYLKIQESQNNKRKAFKSKKEPMKKKKLRSLY